MARIVRCGEAFSHAGMIFGTLMYRFDRNGICFIARLEIHDTWGRDELR